MEKNMQSINTWRPPAFALVMISALIASLPACSGDISIEKIHIRYLGQTAAQ